MMKLMIVHQLQLLEARITSCTNKNNNIFMNTNIIKFKKNKKINIIRYGGMLAAWLRMKFPNIVDMAVASSAPILNFPDNKNAPFQAFSSIINSNYERAQVPTCTTFLREGYKRLETYRNQ